MSVRRGRRVFRGGRRGHSGAEPGGTEKPELIEQRAALAREFSELQWDLGGLVYEMARRDHFRVDVLVAQAARLQEIDAQLGEVERLLHLDQAGAAGTCSSCGALHAHGAVFCWQCGEALVSRAHVEGRIVTP